MELMTCPTCGLVGYISQDEDFFLVRGLWPQKHWPVLKCRMCGSGLIVRPRLLRRGLRAQPIPSHVWAKMEASWEREFGSDEPDAEHRLPDDAGDVHEPAAYWHSEQFGRTDLLPMLPAQDGVCDTCFQGTDGRRCRSCSHSLRQMAHNGPAAVLPISLRFKAGALWEQTWAYKNASSAGDRDNAARKLAWLLQHFMSRHEACLASAAGLNGFDLVVPVPSSGRREETHPLVPLLQNVPTLADRLVEDLRFSGAVTQSHRVDRDRFRVIGGRMRDKRVLLIDDTWTSGANAFSAMQALQQAGAARVAVVFIGRHYDPDYSDATRRYFEHARHVPFDFDFCVHCDRRPEISLSPAPVERDAAGDDPWANPWPDPY